MSKQITGFITWIRTFLDDVYAPKGSGGGFDIDDVYPVGSIYMSVQSTSPSVLFGGTWEQIKDTFLLSAGNTYSAGSTGGSADAVVVTHNHTQNSHNHTQNSHNHTQNSHGHSSGENLTLIKAKTPNQVGRRQVGSGGTNRGYAYTTNSTSSSDALDVGGVSSTVATNQATTATNNATTATNNSTGVDGTGKNMPPYLAVYVWKRIA